MKIRTKLKGLVLLGLLGALVFGFSSGKINPDKMVKMASATTHYMNINSNKNYDKLNIKGVTVFVSKDLSTEDREKVQYAINNAQKTLSDKELQELKMIVYTPSNQLPEYLNKNENINRNVANDLTEGFYVPDLKEIYIFPDIIEKDNSFTQDNVMLFVTLHEIGHHIDITRENNKQDSLAEKRANLKALNKMTAEGIKIDDTVIKNILSDN